MSSVDDPFDARSKWMIIFIEEFDDDRDIGQRLVVLNPEDEGQGHGWLHGWNGANVDGVPRATMDE
jgi:hypothetical protein